MSSSSPFRHALAVVACALAFAPAAWASDPGAKPAAPKRAKLAKPAAAAGAAAVLAELTPEQLASADRVLLGSNACEFNQSVDVKEAPEKKGWFRLFFKGKSYTMAPEPTTTGAVRLEDKLNGLVWLQIADKSMLMNAKIGQRMVDNCVHPAQKT